MVVGVACHLVEGITGLQAFSGHGKTISFQLFESDAFLFGQRMMFIDDGCQTVIEQHLTLNAVVAF